MAADLADAPGRCTLNVRYESSVGEARRAARTLAAAIGFAPQVCEEISIAATELASNLINHARGGTLTLTPVSADGRGGMEIESQDDGPGIADVEQALGDRFSTGRTLGAGLGAVNRLMDQFDIESKIGRGTRVVCRKWLRSYAEPLKPSPLSVGVATRPRTFGHPNGDAFIVHHWGESTLVGIIDGLGHGQYAHRAAQAARQYVETHFDSPLEQIFRGTGRACRATRGVVMALARFDWGQERLTFASIGNISARIFPRSEPFHFVIRRGVIGLNAPPASATEHRWPLDHILVLHSDGIDSHWDWRDSPSFEKLSATAIAQQLLRTRAKREDDATVVVVRDVVP